MCSDGCGLSHYKAGNEHSQDEKSNCFKHWRSEDNGEWNHEFQTGNAETEQPAGSIGWTEKATDKEHGRADERERKLWEKSEHLPNGKGKENDRNS